MQCTLDAIYKFNWKNSSWDYNNTIHLTIHNSLHSLFIVVLYVSIILMLSYHQMQSESSWKFNEILRFNIPVILGAGFIDIARNIIIHSQYSNYSNELFLDKSHGFYLLFQLISGVLIAWAVLVLIASYFYNFIK